MSRRRDGAPVAVLLVACLLAWWLPQALVPLRIAIVPALGLAMFGMGPGRRLATLTGPRGSKSASRASGRESGARPA